MDELKERLSKAQSAMAEETEAGAALEAELASLTAALEAMAAERKQLKASVRRVSRSSETALLAPRAPNGFGARGRT